jgi:hypothetical protein
VHVGGRQDPEAKEGLCHGVPGVSGEDPLLQVSDAGGWEEEALLLQLDGKQKKTKKVLPQQVMEPFKARLFTIIPNESILTKDELTIRHALLIVQHFQESYAENFNMRCNKIHLLMNALIYLGPAGEPI